MESTIKVHYFAGMNGKASNLGAMLSHAGAKFEFVRIPHEDWPALKVSGVYEFGQLPVLEINGKFYAQTVAEEIYIARKYGYLGSNEEEEYQIISLVATRDDMIPKLVPVLRPNEEQKLKREEIFANLNTVEIPRYAEIIEKRFEKNGGKYFIGDKITLADFFISTWFKLIQLTGLTDALSKHAPKVTELVKRIDVEDLAAYYKDVHIA